MKTSLLVAMAIAVSGQVLYHVAQKSVPTGTNPVIALLVFYLGAAVLTLPLLALYPLTDKLSVELGKVGWAVIAVAASIVLIEIGFLLAYRAGGELSTTFVLTAAIVTMATCIVGYVAHSEAFNIYKILGIALCLSGIALISYKST
jgi:drug/metabolite transporter (DMT)-like permease